MEWQGNDSGTRIQIGGAFYRAVLAGLYPGTQQEYYDNCTKVAKEVVW